MSFEPLLCPADLRDADLRMLRAFGVRGALITAASSPPPRTPGAWFATLEALLSRQLGRLERAGIEGWASVGAPPELAEREDLDALLDALPLLVARGTVRAVGPVGLDRNTPAERALLRRLGALAETFRLPLVAVSRPGAGAASARALLSALASGPAPADRVLVVGDSVSAAKAALGLGFRAGLLVGDGARSPHRAVDFVARHGPERVVLASRAGSVGVDLLALPLTEHLLELRGLAPSVRRRVTAGNARTFLERRAG